MTAENTETITMRDRLIKIETEVHLSFGFLKDALCLARETAERDRTSTHAEYEKHFEILNQHKAAMEKLEISFATKDDLAREVKLINVTLLSKIDTIGNAMIAMANTFSDKLTNTEKSVDKELKSLSRIVYIGLGIAITLQVVFKYLLK
jgi:hypothetical protein